MVEIFGMPCDLQRNTIERFLEMKGYEKVTLEANYLQILFVI